MSKLTLAGNASGTGTYTIEAPNSNNSRTMLLPDSAGNLVVTQAVQTLTNKTFSGTQVFGTASLAEPTGNAPLYMARAWVNFNGTGTVAIRASGNVSSITDNGTGSYTVNFTTAMPDVNYNVVGAGRYSIGNGGIIVQPAFDITGTTSAIRIIAMPTTGTAADAEYMNIAIFR